MHANFLELVFTAIGGLILGSFLNVVIHRLPRGESLVRPGSHCPHCDVSLRPWANVPLVSWLVLFGSAVVVASWPQETRRARLARLDGERLEMAAR